MSVLTHVSSNANTEEKQPHWKYTWLATFLVIMASLIFTASNFVVKSEALNSEEVLLVRSVLQTGILFGIGNLRGHTMWPCEASDNLRKVQCSLLFSGLAASTVNFLCYYAVQQIALGDAMAIVFASPLFTLLFEWAFFARPKGIVIKVISAIILISGVVLVIQPPFLKLDNKLENVTISPPEAPEGFSLAEKPWKYAGIFAALGAAMIGGLNNITAWYASSTGKLTPVTIAFYSGLGGLLLSVTIGLLSNGSSNRIMTGRISSIDGHTWGWIIFIALLSMLGFWAQTASLQWIDAPALSSLKALEILFAYLVQVLVMSQTANAMAIIGSSLVMAGVIGIRLAERMLKCLGLL